MYEKNEKATKPRVFLAPLRETSAFSNSGAQYYDTR